MSLSIEILEALRFLSSPEKADILSRFFKTGKGAYGEGDLFLGVKVPESRTIVAAFWQRASMEDIKETLYSKYHEMRLVALLILVMKFEKSKNAEEKKELVTFYLRHTQQINNWDLVDLSCYKILGRYCYENKEDDILVNLSNADSLWEKRIAIVATMFYVKKNAFTLTQDLVLKNLYHPHDLMHKANGWLLREMGKKNEQTLIQFLINHYTTMPRTTLRYAIEKLDEPLRQDFLKGKI